jgi:hypothetical protein
LASLGATDSRGADAEGTFIRLARCGAALRCTTPFLRRFAVPGAVDLVFFFMHVLEGLPGFTKTG